MFETKPGYGTSGAKWAGLANDLAVKTESRTLLDYGCGRGTLKAELLKLNPPYDIIEYDPAFPGKQNKPIRSDIVVCGDVMEHVEPEFINDVLSDIHNISRIGVLFVISTKPAVKHLPDGRNAHLIVERPGWWLEKLFPRWEMKSFNNFGPGFVFVGISQW